jgi:Right handed beta helix region
MRRPLYALAALAALAVATSPAAARVISVGPQRPLVAPSAAAAVARDGDVVEIDAGTYSGDVATWRANRLVIRGVGGPVVLDAAGQSAEGKAIWVIAGNRTTIEGVTFTNARVPDANGAGIRQEGSGLTLRGCVFRANQMGILAGDNPTSDILIERSEFDRNGEGDGQSHNIYVNHVRSFTLRFSWSHDARVGHQVKSRALRTNILYNRIDDGAGDGSYSIDLSNGGDARIVGNLIQQGPNSPNTGIVSYAAEGATNPVHRLRVASNTVVNALAPRGTFVVNADPATRALVVNNLLTGGTLLIGPGRLPRNLIAAGGDSLAPGSPAINRGVATVPALRPRLEYVHPANATPRPRVGRLDIGAFEAR